MTLEVESVKYRRDEHLGATSRVVCASPVCPANGAKPRPVFCAAVDIQGTDVTASPRVAEFLFLKVC